MNKSCVNGMRQSLKVTSTYQVVARQSSPEAEVLLGSDVEVSLRKIKRYILLVQFETKVCGSSGHISHQMTSRSVSPAFSNLLKLMSAAVVT